jgi:hypothetical protein
VTIPIGALQGTAHFSLAEAEAASESAWPPTDSQAAAAQLTLERCETVRHWLGDEPCILSSLGRSATFNATLEDASDHSGHLAWTAADLVPVSADVLANAAQLLQLYESEFSDAGIDRIVVSASHIHVLTCEPGAGAGLLLFEAPGPVFSEVPPAPASAPLADVGPGGTGGLLVLVLLLAGFFGIVLLLAYYFSRGK